MKAIWEDTVIAESDQTIVVEGNHYFPPESIKKEYFEETSSHTACPWKGEASYYKILVNGKEINDGAWFYPQPKKEAEQITNYVAFWKGRGVNIVE